VIDQICSLDPESGYPLSVLEILDMTALSNGNGLALDQFVGSDTEAVETHGPGEEKANGGTRTGRSKR
jgi:hypothetical protein